MSIELSSAVHYATTSFMQRTFNKFSFSGWYYRARGNQTPVAAQAETEVPRVSSSGWRCSPSLSVALYGSLGRDWTHNRNE